MRDVFDADGKARQSDVDALLRARQPAECVPGGNGHPVKTVREPEAIAAECQQLKVLCLCRQKMRSDLSR
ncbi:MAG: hypothetical protein SGPRY_004765, partial [Prymnesium sp.]